MRFTKFCDSFHPADRASAEFFVDLPEGAELEVKLVSKTRTNAQNNAIHAFLRELSKNLNAAGFDLLSFPWKEGVEIPWSLELAKERLWVPIQQVVTDKKKTSELTTAEVDKVYQPLARKISGMGVECPPMGKE